MFETGPFVKMLLHAAKYPHAACNGILLSRKGDSGKHQNIVECIPLFHINLTLVPMLEIALTQIEAYCAEEDLSVAGYYHIHEHLTSHEPDGFVSKVMERLNENCTGAALYMIDNEELNTESIPYTVHKYSDGKLRTTNTTDLEEGALEIGQKAVLGGAYEDLIDFDVHLDEPSKDWRNPDLL